ncbi:MAG TPA: dihydrofolate reductase family protein [Gammaproteobacteria bacterium]|nr:dihydrofolate reductase family protein [Gammaproteobacteria bacterium]
MRKVIVTEFITLDGVIEAPGSAHDFKHAGWTMPYWGDDIGEFKSEELFAADALLLGRKTYEGFAAAWPAMKDPSGFADRMNGMPKYVATKTLKTLSWSNSHALKGEVAQEVAKLKQHPGGDILVAGSGDLVQTLTRHGLVDEFRLLVYPVVLGEGQRLFATGTQAKLELIESRSFKSGVTALRYRSVK